MIKEWPIEPNRAIKAMVTTNASVPPVITETWFSDKSEFRLKPCYFLNQCRKESDPT